MSSVLAMTSLSLFVLTLICLEVSPCRAIRSPYQFLQLQRGVRVSRNLAPSSPINKTWDPSEKEMKICSIMGGLDLTRLRSFLTRTLFKDAIEDVELMREAVTESMYNGGLKGGMSVLEEMAATLDWRARDLPPNSTTLNAELGWVDDRVSRRIERQVTTPNQPFVGSKQADAAFSDTLSNLLPWIRDRRAKEQHWAKPHQNGRTEGISKVVLKYDSLYIGVWIVTPGDAIWYYPPMSAYAHPYTMSDIVGGNYSWRVYPAEPAGWPFNHTVRGGNIKDAVYDNPYADVAHPGLSMISAMAPVYYTGEWYGYEYNDTFIAAVGVDIALDSIANVLHDLENTLTLGSFALVVDANTFKIVTMSQSVVDKIYPERTGNEEERVTYHDVDGSIIDDRRNQTYTVSDTIWQGLLDGVESANWTHLHQQVQATELGGRGYTKMNVTIRGGEPEPYYAMFDRWEFVAEWAVLVMTPVRGVDQAIRPQFSSSQLALQAVKGELVTGGIQLTNEGTLNIIVFSRPYSPSGIQLEDSEVWEQGVRMSPGQVIPINFVINTELFGVGNTTTPVAFLVVDDEYPDCLYSGEISFQIILQVSREENMNYLGDVRIGGLCLCAIAMATSLGFAVWVIVFRKDRVVVASQPLFLIMICIGCCILASSIIPMSIDDEVASIMGCNIACMVSPWTASMGFVTTFSALFSKILRVNKIFRGENKFKRIVVTEMDVIKPFFVLFSLNFAVLLCWTLIDPLRWVRKPSGEWDSYGACRAEGDQYIIFISLVGAINLIALFLACYQAYCAREISDEFSETKYIAVAIGSMLQVVLVGVPILFIVGDNPAARFFMQAAILFVIALAVLLLVFVPKIIFKKNYKKIFRKRKMANEARMMMRASEGISDHPSKSFTESTTDDSPAGVRILEYGTAALQGENDELKDTVYRLKSLLERHDIDYSARLGGERASQERNGRLATSPVQKSRSFLCGCTS